MSDDLLAMLATFVVSLVPMLELRAGIPVGMAMGLPTATATAVAVLGNMTQIRVAVVVIALAYRYCSRIPRVRRWLEQTEARAGRHARLLRKWGWAGLAAFVLLPLPGTGVWGGVVLSRLVALHSAGLWLGLSLGVALSGMLFGLAAHGTLSLWHLFR